MCSVTQPCRQFTRALTQTLAGGEIVVLDSGGYGTVVIAQDVAIISPKGVYAGITVFSGWGVEITTAATKVLLRGLKLTGQGGVNGIAVGITGDVEIDDCEVSGMMLDGLNVTSASLSVRDSKFLRNGQYGIGYASNSGARATFERVLVRGNTLGGIDVQGATALVTGSTIEENGGDGISAGHLTYLTVRDSVVTTNAHSGLRQQAGYLRVEHSTISVNGGYGVWLTTGADAWIIGNTILDNQQSGTQGSSQVCACDAASTASVRGNTVNGFTPYGFESVGIIGSFGDNATLRPLGGHNFSPADLI